MFKRLLLTLGLLTGIAFAQSGGAFGGVPVIFPSGQYVPNASIRVCQTPASGTPCSNLATIYTDATLAFSQSNPIALTPLNFGQFSFGAAQGNYQVQISAPGLNTYSFPVTFGIPSGTTIASPTITNPTVSNGTFSAPTLTNPIIKGSMCPSGATACQEVRTTSVCTTGATSFLAASACATTMTWNTAFPDANYTAVCSPSTGVVSGVPLLWYVSKSPTQVTVNFIPATSVAAQFSEIDCAGWHD
jgi:hypothetical protein